MAKIRTRGLTLEEKFEIVSECRKSGIPAAQWLKERGIYEATYYGWIKQLKQAACSLPESVRELSPEAVGRNEIVRVDLTVPALHAEPEAQTAPSLEVVLGGATVRIYRDAAPELLTMTLQALRRAGC